MSRNAVSAAQLRRLNLRDTAAQAEQYKAQRHFLDFANKIPLPLQERFLNNPEAFANSRLPVPGLLMQPARVSKFQEINMSKGDFSQYLAYDKLSERNDWNFEILPTFNYTTNRDLNNPIDQIHDGMVNGTIETLGVVDYKTTRHRYLKDTSANPDNRSILGRGHVRTGDIIDIEHWEDGGNDYYRVLNRTTEAAKLQSKGIGVDWANGIPTIGGHKKKYSGKKRGRKPKAKVEVAA